jgi:outer membrane biogenesis lipoprotein LolB
MLWNRAHVILVLAASVALAACDAGPSSQSAGKRPLRDSKQRLTQQDRDLATVQRWQRMGLFGENEQDDRARTDPRRFQRRETYRPQPNYQTVPEYGDYHVPDATYGQ